MPRYLIPLGLLLVVTCLLFTSCSAIGYIAGTGPIVNQAYEFSDFKNVEISNAFGFDISRADEYSLTISAHENLFQHLDIKKSGDTLIIRMKTGSYTNSETKAIITLPNLSTLKISGACRGTLHGFKANDDFDLVISGASQLEINSDAGLTHVDISGASKINGILNTSETKVKVSGASQCDLSGSAQKGDLEISGASHFNSVDFRMQDCIVNTSGASTAKISASGTLKIVASGASTVKYSGSPTIKGLDVSGASHVNGE
jgi:hypothetical protein